MSFLGFLLKKNFYINVGISIVLTVLILIAAFNSLRIYTRHGKSYVIPDLEGKLYDRLTEDKATRIFNFLVTDSVYDNSLLPGSIIKQNPSAGSKAKEGRTVYLTVVSKTPKMSIMPELKDLTVRQAVTTLRTSGLKIRRLIFTPYFAGNSVLGQYFNGDTLLAGTEILEESSIDLVAGLGDNQGSRVPYLIGLTHDEAHASLQMASFNAGMEHYLDGLNPLHSRVYRQYPAWDAQLRPGDSVTLYFRSDLKFNFDSLLISSNPDTAVIQKVPADVLGDSTELEED
jgi:beta-lactam-binding protein with PASTA domain